MSEHFIKARSPPSRSTSGCVKTYSHARVKGTSSPSHTLSLTHTVSLSLSPAERALGGKAPKPKLKPKPKPLLERVAKHTRKGRSTEEGPKLGCPKALPQMIVRTSEWIQRCNGATGEGTTERREFNSDGDEKECVCLAGNKAGMVSGWARSRGTGLRD